MTEFGRNAKSKEALREIRKKEADKRVVKIRNQRSQEDVRRQILRDIRLAVAADGKKAVVRLAVNPAGSHYELAVDPQIGFHRQKFSARFSVDSPGVDIQMIKKAIEIADLQDIAERRKQAIEAARHAINNPPAWAFLVHPIVRGILASLSDDPTKFRPLFRQNWPGKTQFSGSASDLRLTYSNVVVDVEGVFLKVKTENQFAKITIDGKYPETYVSALPGKRFCDVVKMPGMEAGTIGGDMIIRDAWCDDELVFTVKGDFVPMADAPPGQKNDWLFEWLERHCK